MTRIILISSFLLQSLWGLSQVSQTIEKYNIDKDCDKDGQQEMNVCLINAEKELSKIMQTKYDCLIAYFDMKIKIYSVKDTLMASEYLEMKKNIIASQTTWRKLTNENASFYKSGGGTITPMLVARSLIADLKDRLKWLDNAIEELGQGNEIDVLKCE